MFEKFLKRSSWIDIVISLIFLVFGILLITKPNETVQALSIILGVIFIAMGILKLIEYFSGETRDDYLLTIALVTVVFGVIVLFCSDLILSFFRVILGIWIIAAGIMDLQTTLVWKNIKSPYWTATLVISMLMMGAGILVLVNQEIVLTTVGIIIVVYAVLDVIDRIIFMKKVKDHLKEEN